MTSTGNPNDFVIRDGFPALRLPRRGRGSSKAKMKQLPSNNGKNDAVDDDSDNDNDRAHWNIDGDEPLPRFDVWAADHCFDFHNSNNLQTIQDDCRKVFSARTREDGASYSNGTTYFLPSQMKPRCVLEAMVQTIFQAHTRCLLQQEEGGEQQMMMIPEQSGAEWWTLVLETNNGQNKKEKGTQLAKDEEDDEEEDDDDDEVGMHFDADYGLEDQAPNLLLHPRVATVTYLTDLGTGGAPTVILNQRSPPPNDVEKSSLQGPLSKAWVSHPKLGKHVAFDGRLLHGAPATFFPTLVPSTSPSVAPPSVSTTKELSGNEPPSKRVKLPPAACPSQRITLLVNVWVNHCPLDAEPLEEEICQTLTPLPPSDTTTTTTTDGTIELFSWTNPDLDQPPEMIRVSLKPSSIDPAGEEEVVICNRLVTIKYNPTMEGLHEATRAGELVAIEFAEGAARLEVGEEVQEEEEEEEDEDENKEEGNNSAKGKQDNFKQPATGP